MMGQVGVQVCLTLSRRGRWIRFRREKADRILSSSRLLGPEHPEKSESDWIMPHGFLYRERGRESMGGLASSPVNGSKTFSRKEHDDFS